MRIVGGTFKGRSLVEFSGEEVRPTADMTRESLFNIIKAKISGADFLDLFCGTGAVGIEALSCGAKVVTFNDISKKSLEIVKKNLIKVDKESVVKFGVNAILKNYDALDLINSTEGKFDIIFIDAPYSSDKGLSAVNICHKILKDDGIVIFESENIINQDFDGLKKIDKRKYGRARLTFFSKI